MSSRALYAIWGGLFILCAGLGFIPNPTGAGKVLLVILAVVFFVPGAMLTCRGAKAGDRKALGLVRNLSALSLGLTLAALVANILSVLASETAGNVLYGLLIIVSTPMICGQYWVMSLFLWACLLIVSISCLRRRK